MADTFEDVKATTALVSGTIAAISPLPSPIIANSPTTMAFT